MTTGWAELSSNTTTLHLAEMASHQPKSCMCQLTAIHSHKSGNAPRRKQINKQLTHYIIQYILQYSHASTYGTLRLDPQWHCKTYRLIIGTFMGNLSPLETSYNNTKCTSPCVKLTLPEAPDTCFLHSPHN